MASVDAVKLFDTVDCNFFIGLLPKILADTEHRWRPLTPLLDGIPISVIIQMFKQVLAGSFLSFDDKIFQQCRGVPMGNPLSVSVSDLILGHFEETLIQNCPEHLRPLLYGRFVDDIFLIFDSIGFPLNTTKKEIVQEFNEYLHKEYGDTAIRFTHELEVELSIPFLDVRVLREEEGFPRLTVYRKKTQSNRYLSRFSNVPRSFILSVLNTLKIRALRYISDPDDLAKEMTFLIDIFATEHGYDKRLVESFFKLDSLVSTCKLPPPISLGQLVVPFFGQRALELKSYMSSLGIQVVFKSGAPLRSLLFNPSFEY